MDVLIACLDCGTYFRTVNLVDNVCPNSECKRENNREGFAVAENQTSGN